jgi:hypothetical protein
MSNTSPSRRRRFAGVLAVTTCTALAASAPAFADDTPVAADGTATAVTTAASNAECVAPTLFQPFTAFKDNRQYVLAPGGDFSDPAGAGWQLGGGAAIVDDTNPDGTVDGVLEMPSGAVVVSPTMCVDLDYPTARAWIRTVAGDGDVRVSVMYDAGKTARQPKEVGHAHGNKSGWALSPDLKIQPQLGGKQAGWRRVAFVLTAGGRASTFRVDDFYVDPRMVR